ncbi:hypothetical protein [Aurantibacillus circumpalustris]|uniref:hypothetical protein n=1 Tax=Aurantibacillus circumpalustris TaxID=3036359 RepID=UPI00295C31B6|nr:hypothetical protein [Aurantibacillus circumpalustris]
MKQIIKQKGYHDIEIEDREKDVVEVWGLSETDMQVLHIERENIERLITALKIAKNRVPQS